MFGPLVGAALGSKVTQQPKSPLPTSSLTAMGQIGGQLAQQLHPGGLKPGATAPDASGATPAPPMNEGFPGAPGMLNPMQPPQGSAPAPQGPSPTVPQPTTGRQQALNTISQSYAAPTSYMPGNALGMMGGNLFSQLSATPSLTDSTLAPAVAAGRLSDDRTMNKQRAIIAEQMGAQGLGNSGAENAAVRSAQQGIGEQAAMRDAGLLRDESQQRRAALLQALGLDQNRYQFDNTLGFNFANLQQQANQQALLAALGLV